MGELQQSNLVHSKLLYIADSHIRRLVSTAIIHNDDLIGKLGVLRLRESQREGRRREEGMEEGGAREERGGREEREHITYVDPLEEEPTCLLSRYAIVSSIITGTAYNKDHAILCITTIDRHTSVLFLVGWYH